jgi:hypothetical protein
VGIARLPGLAHTGLTELAGGAEWLPGPVLGDMTVGLSSTAVTVYKALAPGGG